jgi:hypothetical protein
VFSTKGLDTSGSKFTTAQQKCKTDLPPAFQAGSSGAGSGGGGATSS